MCSQYRLADESRRHAAARPDALALTGRDGSMTFAELDLRTSRLANVLLDLGCRSGTRVAVVDRGSTQVVEIVLAAAKIGAVAIPINWRLSGAEVAEVLADADARVLFFHSEFEGVVSAVQASGGTKLRVVRIDGSEEFDYEARSAGASSVDPGWSGSLDDVVLQLYTSGTTAKPKGVLTSNRNLEACTRTGGPWGFDESSVSLCAMPLFHIGGLGWALVGLANGAHNVVLPEFTPAGLLEVLEGMSITNTFLVPSVIGMLVDVPGARERNLATLRSIAYGSSPITPWVLKRALETFRKPLFQVYGLTETHGAVTQLDSCDHAVDGEKVGLLRSVGKPYPWVDLKVMSPEGEEVAVGEAGEIYVRSPQTTEGYYRRPEETAAAIDTDGWFHTGDVGRVDSEGYVYITDRMKDMIITGGENVYPIEVESVIADYPGVSQVAVIGVEDPLWGEAVKAVVVAAAGHQLDTDSISGFVRSRLAGYKCPKSIEIVTELPLGATGKILKRELRARYRTV
ncbi:MULTISPECIES: long-chain-fatty-acid--CoA ligase [Rhodococcus]|uniref:long-chain-fatty-acid--CoA ligase n=1 Tax=Rhodococcus TaxID=1827 RepID=UPI0018A2E808|nr:MULTISPECIES: long-chain-fatty-acid--CoA ligase [Rhodococcus]MBF7735384.1 long-chain-fatty-acid--CoA ligase [Rhodococcus erythropolis]MCZ4642462.1 long-chain-fatty-acid--CoA ligase [Rhodococcus erythropolis]MDI9907516.1 long-chain-fatty-acid--CoA ligase [Rhodococcus sp. IEGM 1406]